MIEPGPEIHKTGTKSRWGSQSTRGQTGPATAKKCWGAPGCPSLVLFSLSTLSAHLSQPPLLPTYGKIHSCPVPTLEATSSSSQGHWAAGKPGTLSPTTPAVLLAACLPPSSAGLLVLTTEYFHLHGIFNEVCLQLGRRAKPLFPEAKIPSQSDTGRCVSESDYHSRP